MEASESLHALIGGHRSTALIYVAAKLRLADLLARKPASSYELAEQLQVNANALHRILRGLVAVGLLREANGTFALTAIGECLKTDVAGSLYEHAILTGEEYAPAWALLLCDLQSCGVPFEKIFGMNVWEHRTRNPELGRLFQQSLAEQTASLAHALLRIYNFSTAGVIVDIGGGTGKLLHRILERNPEAQGILFELPHVLENVANDSPNRFRAESGDFFQRIPAGADIYLLKSVLHDWNDARCRQILECCREAMKQTSRLLVIERQNPQHAADDTATIMMDLHMMAVQGGRERTHAEFDELARSCGLVAVQARKIDEGFWLMEFAPSSAA
jgi:O-methyltransferase domain/Dimerisation domain